MNGGLSEQIASRYQRDADRLREQTIEQEEREAIQSEDVPRPELPTSKPDWPRPLKSPAFHGLAGEIVRAIDPHTEADPAAVLFSLLAASGNALGGAPHQLTESDRQTANLFAVLVGKTASARKGTAWGHVRRMMERADPEWTKQVRSGLSSGEGIIWAVRDPNSQTGDEGVLDKRLLAYQSEFASVLRVLRREGNTLSPVMREAWDRGDLGILTKNSPTRATGAHVSLLGHVTRTELLRHFDDTEAANGWGNRILWVCSKRSKLLPDGGSVPKEQIDSLAKRLGDALSRGRGVGELIRTAEATELWRKVYPKLTTERAGLLGAVTARAAPQVVRLSVAFALLNEAAAIGVEHLQAALAVWQYADDSARYIFGDATGDKDADRILSALRERRGLSRTDIRDVFQHNKSAYEIDRALGILEAAGLARKRAEPSGGRPVEYWEPAPYDKNDIND